MIKEDDKSLIDFLDRFQILSRERHVSQAVNEIDAAERNKINVLIAFVTRNPIEGVFRISSKGTELSGLLSSLTADDATAIDEPILASNALKALWRDALIIPPRFYYPLLRSLHVKSTIKRIELLQRILLHIDVPRRLLLQQVLLVSSGLVEDGRCKLDMHGMAVLLSPCVFSQRPAIALNGFPMDTSEPDLGPTAADLPVDEDLLVVKEVDWMIELFTFMAKQEQRIFTPNVIY